MANHQIETREVERRLIWNSDDADDVKTLLKNNFPNYDPNDITWIVIWKKYLNVDDDKYKNISELKKVLNMTDEEKVKI